MRTKDRWRVEGWEDEKESWRQKTDRGWRTGEKYTHRINAEGKRGGGGRLMRNTHTQTE